MKAKFKYTIYRRLFNPAPEQKNLRVTVASFSRHAKEEAEFCLAALQNEAISFADKHSFAKYRYTLDVQRDPVNKQEVAGLQIDDTKAIKTGRLFKYELTWDIKHDECHMIAYHARYGSIRATVENTVEARQWFRRAITRVWPNARQS